MNYIGIDIGTSNIKIVELGEDCTVKNKMILEKMQPKKALKKFIDYNNINLDEIKEIIATGVGANEFEHEILNKKVFQISEFLAIGSIGEITLKTDNFIVASLGTGTAFIKNENGVISHLGGSGVGGGTLINLCKKLVPEAQIEDIYKSGENGNLKNIDLTVQDITTEEIKTLPKDTTAVNFGKLDEKASNEDIILGIVNMTFEIIGVMAAFAAKGSNIKNIIAIGQMTKIPYARKVFDEIEGLHNVKFIIPQNAEYGTAIGAIKYHLNKK